MRLIDIEIYTTYLLCTANFARPTKLSITSHHEISQHALFSLDDIVVSSLPSQRFRARYLLLFPLKEN